MVQVSIITGANRGLGQTIAHTLLTYYSQPHLKTKNQTQHLILIGRTPSQLEGVKQELLGLAISNNLNVHVYTVGEVELKEVEKLQFHLDKVGKIVKEITETSEFQNELERTLVLFNNAGTLGDISKKASQFSAPQVLDYTAVNLASFAGFSSELKNWSKDAQFTKTFLVNISSLAATTPFVYNSLYCSIKAARDMFLQVYALEEPSIKVLNYAPGPLDNSMQEELRTKLGDEENRKMFQSYFEEKKLVDMKDTSTKLLDILHYDDFLSGWHIDYYDYELQQPKV